MLPKLKHLPILAVSLMAPTALFGQITTDNLVYNWDANTSLSTDTTWTSSAPGSNTSATWSIEADQTLNTSTGSSTGISQAWRWGGTSSLPSVGSFAAMAPDSSFEIWFSIDSLLGSNEGQTIFETGGNARGMSINLFGDQVIVLMKQGGAADAPEVVLTYTLTESDISDFIQIVVTTSSTTNALYVNSVNTTTPGAAADSSDIAYGNYGGTNQAGLGGFRGNEIGGASSSNTIAAYAQSSYDAFSGEIGLMRFYDDTLTGGEVASNYYSTIPEPGQVALSLAALVLVAAGIARRRKR
jgi:hypothetical protein